MDWHHTNSLETKILQAKHGLNRWDVYHSPAAGLGVVNVLEGPLPQPPRLIHNLLRVEGVTRVISDTLADQDYFLITISDPKFWDQVKADIQGVILHDRQRED